MTAFTRERVSSRDLGLSLLRWQPERAERCTVVLLHGFADCGASFDPIARELAARGHTAVAIDQRGFGDSERVGRGGYYHFPDYVADVDALVSHLGGAVAVVGHSMGGTVATLFAGARPALVERLVLLEGLGPPDNDPAHTPDRFATWLDDMRLGGRSRNRRLDSEVDALTRLAAQHPGVDRETLARVLPHLVERADDGLFWRVDPLHRTTAPVPFLVATWKAFAARVRCPVLLIGGGSTGYHPLDEAERAAAFAQVRQVEIEGAGHMLHWTRPREVAAQVLTFLASG